MDKNPRSEERGFLVETSGFCRFTPIFFALPLKCQHYALCGKNANHHPHSRSGRQGFTKHKRGSPCGVPSILDKQVGFDALHQYTCARFLKASFRQLCLVCEPPSAFAEWSPRLHQTQKGITLRRPLCVWWKQVGSNHRPLACQASTLTN